jgi:hypothetical protein
MKVISPTPLTTALLGNSSVPETDYAEWNAATTYGLGDRCIKAATHRVYQSVVANNKGFDPAASTNWADQAPTNRWAMFDQVVGTVTTGTGTITVTLAPGLVGALAVLDTNADSVQVQVSIGGTKVYDRTQFTSRSGGIIADWYAYFTAAIGKLQAISFLDLPLAAAAQITVTITGPDPQGPVRVGTMLVGAVIDLGSTATGGTIGIVDYSLKDKDAFGNTRVVERAWSKQGQLRTMIDTDAVDGIQRDLAALRATPALWLGEDGFDSLAIYGFFKEFQVELALRNISYLSLTVEGLI